MRVFVSDDWFVQMCNECEMEIKNAGIPVGALKDVIIMVNNRAGRALGLCETRWDGSSIYINPLHYKSSIKSAIKDTVIHELLHAIYPRDHHTGNWKKAATIMNRKYGYDIKRLHDITESDSESYKLVQQYKYAVYCKSCNKLIAGYMKRTKFITTKGSGYRCGLCRGTSFKCMSENKLFWES